MGRPRKSRKQGVSLFPFLDILACVIGNLILIITTVVLEQVDTQPVAEAARIDDLAEQARRSEATARELEQQVNELRQRSGVANEKLAAVRRQIAEAQARAREALQRAEEAAKPPEKPHAVEASLKKLLAEQRTIEAEIKDLEQQIAERRKPPEQMIAILPSGEAGGPRKGVFVEAAKDGLVIHEGDTPWKVPVGKIATDPKFKALLEKVRGDAGAIVTFLVRSDGLGSLAAGQRAAEAAGTRSGRVPLPGQGALDLSGAK